MPIPKTIWINLWTLWTHWISNRDATKTRPRLPAPSSWIPSSSPRIRPLRNRSPSTMSWNGSDPCSGGPTRHLPAAGWQIGKANLANQPRHPYSSLRPCSQPHPSSELPQRRLTKRSSIAAVSCSTSTPSAPLASAAPTANIKRPFSVPSLVGRFSPRQVSRNRFWLTAVMVVTSSTAWTFPMTMPHGFWSRNSSSRCPNVSRMPW